MRDIRPHQPNKSEFDFYEVTDIPKRKLSGQPIQPAAKKPYLRHPSHQPNPAPSRGEKTPLRPIPSQIEDDYMSKQENYSRTHVPVASLSVPKKTPANETPGDSRPMFARPKTVRTTRVRLGKNERAITLSFIALALVVTLIAAVLFLPTANISMQLKTAPLLLNEEIVIGTNNNDSAVPGTAFLREIKIAGTHKVANSENIGVKSTGVVNIINRTGETQKIKENSRLVTSQGSLFYMKKHAIVPPNSSVPVDIEAAEPGSAGNIEPQKLYFAALDETAKNILFAENTRPFTGGKSDLISIVADSDFDLAKQSAVASSLSQAEKEIRADLPGNWIILEESWRSDISDFQPSAKAGEKIPEFSYTARASVKVIGYDKTILEEKLRQSLETKLDPNYMLFPGPISYTQNVKNVNWDDASAELSLRITHTTIPSLSLDTLKEKMTGRSINEAKEYLEGLPAIKTASIELWPFWINTIPRIEKRISIDLLPEKTP